MNYDIQFDELNFLSEMYGLQDAHFSIIKENIKREHLYHITKDPQILIEGFTDILDNIGKVFSKMIETIKEFFRKALMYISSYFMELDKFCNTYKKELNAIKKVSFTVDGFKFTLHDAPNMTEFQKVVDSYNGALADVKKLKRDDIKQEQAEYLGTSNLNRIRGEISGIGKPISDDDFLEEVRKYYRNGEIDKQEIEVDETMFRLIVNGASELVKGKKEAEKTRDKLLTLLNAAEKFFSTKAAKEYNGGKDKFSVKAIDITDNKFSTKDSELVDYSETSYGNMELLLKFKYNQTREIANIVNTVTTERVNAFKDQIKMHREIIQKALYDKNTDADETDK